MCSPDTLTLQPRINNRVCLRRVVRADQIPLTEEGPRLVQSWKVPDLNDSQADMTPVVEGTHN